MEFVHYINKNDDNIGFDYDSGGNDISYDDVTKYGGKTKYDNGKNMSYNMKDTENNIQEGNYDEQNQNMSWICNAATMPIHCIFGIT